ncbi:hypothetical protein [Rhizobium sp. SYY.PMSO]|uniref:hypothetical protein n=1 Tax=Rhizobium sp. SYY.PMSO TaxID=3382192 RepID=UPI00399025CF
MRFFTWVILGFLFTPVISYACPAGYASDSFGFCEPTSGHLLTAADQYAQRFITLADALAKGNDKAIDQALGDVLVNSPGCLGCAGLAHEIAPGLTKEQINEIVGDGAITFYTTGDPVLVMVDVGQKLVTEKPIATMPIAPSQSPGPRPPVGYSVQANCIIGHQNLIVATLPSNAVFKSPQALSAFPWVDVRADDLIYLTARSDCPFILDRAAQTASYTAITVKLLNIKSASANEIVLSGAFVSR